MRDEKKLVVLAVDHDPRSLESLAAVLEGEFEVETTTLPREALKMVARRQYDVVISDWDMPDMDGLALATQLIESGDTASCLILTSRADELLGKIGFDKMGTISAMQKSGDREKLINTVRTIGRLARGRHTLAAMKSGAGPKKA